MKWGNGQTENKDSVPLSKASSNGKLKEIIAPLEGRFYLTQSSADQGIKVGDSVKKGDTVAYIESMKVINAIVSDEEGKVVEILYKHGDDVEEDEPIIKLA